jgi:divalent metal cation (Fe/Co/Zn/Cd) transporter
MSLSPGTFNQDDCCGSSAAPAGAIRSPLPAQVAWLQWITIAWMTVECAASLIAAARAHSVALLAFGSDSLVELLSAVVVLLQFLPRFPLSRHLANRAGSVLLYSLAVLVVSIAALDYGGKVQTSCLGMAVTAAALVAMPGLAWLKRRQARRIDNRALAADAMQSATCAYLAAVTLAGLAANSLWHIAWFDSLAGLAAVPVLLLEARRSWRGEECGCAL